MAYRWETACLSDDPFAGDFGNGEVAEWSIAAVLKTASRERRNTAENSQTRTSPSRNNRVHRPFAKNGSAQESAQ